MNTEKQVRKLVMIKLPKFWLYVVFSFVFALVIQLIALIPPILMKNIIDIYIPDKNMNKAIISIFIFALIPIITTTCSTFYNYCLNIAGRKMGQILTIMGFEKLIYQPIEYFDKNNSSELASYCKSEAMSYVVFWIFDIPQLFANILSGIVIFLLILDINIFIALGLLLYAPLSLLPSKYFAKKIEGYIKRITENNAKSSQLISDTFRGIKFVKTMVIEKIQLAKIKDINKDTVKVWSKTVAIDNLNGSWTNDLIDNLFTGVIFATCAVLIIADHLTLGMLVLILNYMPRIFSVIKSISKANFDFRKQLAQYDKFFNLIVMEDEKDKNNEKNSFKFNSKIEFKNVSFAYTEERGNILNSLNITLHKNQWIGIIGNSGAGKTTIFDLLLKLYDNYEGEILVDGVDLKDINAEDLRKSITKVSQDMFLFPGTIRDNLLLINPRASEGELLEVIDKVGLSNFINNLPKRLDTNIGEDGIQLSGGEKQRLCLAQGLLRKSKILLLDEVTANVDNISENDIKNTIHALMKENDLTVITISHRLNFLDKTSKIFVVKKGQLVDEGSFHDLKNHNSLFNVKS